jgi:uncharacterized protein HemY
MLTMHEGFDGQKHRSALTAAEQALRALGAGDAGKARKAAAKASDLDQIGLYSGLVAAVAPLADRLDRGEAIDDVGWDSLVETLGLGPLSGLIDELRG